MAFSKAKLLRFNEIKSCAPPPGAYNPKYKAPVVCGVIPKSERFIDLKSPTASVCSDAQSVCSAKSAPTFNTPTIPTPRRKKLLRSITNKKLLNSADKNEPAKLSEAYNPKICELETKIEDLRLTINDLTEKINETLLEKTLLHEKLEKTKEEKSQNERELRENYEIEISELNRNFDKILLENKIGEEQKLKELKTMLLQQNIEDIKELKNNIIQLEQALETTEQERDFVLKNLEEKLVQSEQKCSELQLLLFNKSEKLKNLENALNDSKTQINDLKQNHLSEIKSLNELHKSEVQDLEYELLKSVTDWQNVVDNLQKDHNKKIQEIYKEKAAEISKIQDAAQKMINQHQFETDAQITQISENCTEKIRLVEIQSDEKIKEINEDWSLKLAQQQKKADEILKECQSISEFSIIQSEIEKNEISSRLRSEKEVLESENITLQEIIGKLKNEMAQIMLELKHSQEKLSQESKNHSYNLEKAKILQHGYEVSLSKAHETINALKNRLLHSDRDVEQLKTEVETLETFSVTCESKISTLETHLENTQIEKKCLELENSCLKMELESNVKSIEQSLHQKVDEIQKIANKKINILSDENKKLQNFNKDTLDQLHDQQEAIAMSKLLLEQSEQKYDELSEENFVLKERISRMEQEFLQNQVNKVDELNKMLKGKDVEISTLKKMIQDQNALIGPFREQLELYEREKETLLNDKQSAEKEMKEMSLKYAEILGHQNKKQKIKYMVDLKKRNLELQESKKDFEEKVFKQSLLIDSLRHELKLLKSKNDKKKKRRSKSLIIENKENVLSPVKTTQNNNSFKIDSPLKDRN